MRVYIYDPEWLLVPPINGGLHCGHHLWAGGTAGAFLVPPINSGLHCGVPWAGPSR